MVEGASSTTPQPFCIWPTLNSFIEHYIFYAKAKPCIIREPLELICIHKYIHVQSFAFMSKLSTLLG